MAKILDQFGQPFNIADIAEPQTSRVTALENTYIESQLGALSPSRAAAILAAADQGDITAQHRLFEDMKDRDAHLMSEMGKRASAPLTLDWSIEPPFNATAAEKKAAAWAEEILRTAVDDLEDVLTAMMDAVGHGFAPIELEWALWGGERIPKFHPRPQDWFRLSPNRRELRLADGTMEGARLVPMGWIMHTHGKAKTGYQSRMALFRVLVWPFIYKAYSIGDLAEFLETYGLPIIVGKYYRDAQPEEKASLMRAVTALGHDARAIMPKEMELEIQKVTGSGDSAAHLAMVDWAERSESKAILGQVLSAEAKATGMGSGVADLQGEVRSDIKRADARQLMDTLTRDLIYPLITFNKPGIDGLRRCPRFVFDLGEAEDLELYANALPKLAEGGARIPVNWVHDKLRIPQAADGEAVFGAAPAPVDSAASAKTKAVMSAQQQIKVEDTADKATPALATQADPALNEWIVEIEAMLQEAQSLEQFRDMLLTRYADLPADQMVSVMTAALAAVELRGRAEVVAGQ